MGKFKISPNKWSFWLIIAIVVKGIFLWLRITYYSHDINIYDTFGFDGGDTSSYIDPIENFLQTGNYFDDFRMPGYGFVYYPLRLLFSQSLALNSIIVLQTIVSAVSVYILSLIALQVFKRNTHFYLCFFIYLASTFVSIYDAYLLTESFCTSAIIFSVYFLLQNSTSSYFLSGLFCTWAVFLRPVFLPLFFIFILFLFLQYFQHSSRNTFKKLLINAFIVLFPFFLIDGVWVLRNYENYGRVIPLTKSVYYPSTEHSYKKHLFQFMNAFGGSIVYWEPGSEITFFTGLTKNVKVREEGKLPNDIYTSQFNSDSLYKIRALIQQIETNSLEKQERNRIEKQVIKKLDRYTQSIKDEKPFLYYVKSRIRVVKTFLLHPGTYNLFSVPFTELSFGEKAIKLFYSLFYLFILGLGACGLVSLLARSLRSLEYFLLSSIGIYSTFIFPIVLKMDEYRYFVPAYPFFTLAAVFIVLSIYYKRVNKV